MRYLITVLVIWTAISIADGEKSDFHHIHRFLTKAELKEVFNVENHADVPEYDVVFVRTRRNYPEFERRRNEREMSTQPFWLKGKGMEMELKLNAHLISPSLKVVKVSSEGKEEMETPKGLCYYIGRSGESVAALSNCGRMDPAEMSGVIMMPDKVLSVKPIPRRMRIELRSVRNEREAGVEDVPHVIHEDTEGSKFTKECQQWTKKVRRTSRTRYPDHKERNSTKIHSRQVAGPSEENLKDMYLELGLFVDETCTKRFRRYYSDKEFRDLILGYVNQVQAIYFQPIIRRKLFFSIVYLEMFSEQPFLLRTLGQVPDYLNKFCVYQSENNSKSDLDRDHWDLAVLLTGKDLFRMKRANEREEVLGMASVDGTCDHAQSCAVIEFGTISHTMQPPVTSGLASTYVTAHEIGHSLGMQHDGPPFNPKCPTVGFLMASGRTYTGCTTWSTCSANFMSNMSKDCLRDPTPPLKEEEEDHLHYGLIPGQTWEANEQCRLFLRDDEASVYNRTLLKDICEEIICISPNFPGLYYAGPAIDGTYCGGDNMWCQYGKCVKANKVLQKIPGGWSRNGFFDAENFKCESGCIVNSLGVARLTRRCDNPRPKNTEGCDGYREGYHLCNDSAICKERIPVKTYANQRCQEFKKYIRTLTSEGAQSAHALEVPGVACMVFCKNVAGEMVPPFPLLQELGIQGFFPDGTLCHTTPEGERYYCRAKQCTKGDIHFRKK